MADRLDAAVEYLHALMTERERLRAENVALRNLIGAVQKAKQRPGIASGEDSGSFNVVLHGNWFIVAAGLVPTGDSER